MSTCYFCHEDLCTFNLGCSKKDKEGFCRVREKDLIDVDQEDLM